jgi:hypothetical protein
MLFCDKVKVIFGEERKNLKFTRYKLNECFLTQEFKNSRDYFIFEATAAIVTLGSPYVL